jgi:hypothetical protein
VDWLDVFNGSMFNVQFGCVICGKVARICKNKLNRNPSVCQQNVTCYLYEVVTSFEIAKTIHIIIMEKILMTD